MSVEIIRVTTKRQLADFVDFSEKLYKGSENWVPPLRGDEFDTFNPKKNGAYDYCQADCFLAMKEGSVAGRVAAIINSEANRRWNQKTVRFGWLDFIEDEEVLKALLDKVAEWGRERGCEDMRGPWGFTDMDKEGLLVEGYENLCPFTCLYNYPYYDTLLRKLGFEKDVDWTQKTVTLTDEYPVSFKFADTIEKRFGLHVYKAGSTFELARKYGMDLFHMYNETFSTLAETSPLTDKQIRNYLSTYVPILDKDFVPIVVNAEGKPVGFAFCVPTLAKAVKKSNGRLFPLGIFRILRALRKNDTLEALMIGVLPEYQGSGAAVLLFKFIHENCLKRGIKTMILNPQLETNTKVQSLFGEYETTPYMRRRAYIKHIG